MVHITSCESCGLTDSDGFWEGNQMMEGSSFCIPVFRTFITDTFFQHLLLLLVARGGESNQYPQGYYPFEESPAKIPPKVRKPPYLQTSVPCPGVLQNGASGVAEPTLDNLCGDLNKGYLPLNPIGQNVEGVSYPL